MATRIAGTYALIGSAWIVISDGVMVKISQSSNLVWLEDSVKGLLFVAVTALLLHTAIRRMVGRFESVEAALRASDERLKFALEGVGDGVWDWDGETKKTYFSPRWKAMLGHTESEIGDDNDEWENRIHPDDRANAFEQIRRHYAGESEIFRCEHRLRTKSGAYLWVLSRGRVVLRAPDGRPLRAIGTHADISARKSAEARMQDALAFNETILRSAPVPILTYRTDGSVVSANAAAIQFVGADLATVMHQNFRQLESWKTFGLLAAADSALNENKIFTREGRYVTTFGRHNWSEMTFAPFTHDGEQRLLLIVRDLTQHHSAIERLELLHAALEATPTGWVVTGADGMIEWANAGFTKLTGYRLDEVVGRKPSVLKSDRHPVGFYANLWQTVKDGRIWQGQICNRRKDGTLYYERMTIAPVRDDSGVIAHFVAMKEDITGQHDLEQQLARSQRLESIGLLASGIAHDLNNMLSPIVLSVGLIKERHKDRETVQLLDLMQAAAQRGAGVVQQVLTFARGVEGERMTIDVRPLVKELAQLARETFPREIRVVLEVSAVALFVEGDVTPLHQVLLNLAVNARDAMPDGGVLTLRAQAVKLDEAAARLAPGGRAGDYVKLGVADTGAGIPPEILEHIFEPFFTTKPRGKGTGLGLSTVYGIVRSHEGFVDVRSKVGEGTEFSVLLPASRTAVTAAPIRPAHGSVIDGAGRRVLVVDDEASVRDVTERVLRRRGFAVVTASGGTEAMTLLSEKPEDFFAVITDLMMPGMNGYALAREIRQRSPALPIIVASGMVGEAKAGEDRAALAAIGVRTVLNKPFAEADLLEALQSVMGAPALDAPLAPGVSAERARVIELTRRQNKD